MVYHIFVLLTRQHATGQSGFPVRSEDQIGTVTWRAMPHDVGEILAAGEKPALRLPKTRPWARGAPASG